MKVGTGDPARKQGTLQQADKRFNAAQHSFEQNTVFYRLKKPSDSAQIDGVKEVSRSHNPLEKELSGGPPDEPLMTLQMSFLMALRMSL